MKQIEKVETVNISKVRKPIKERNYDDSRERCKVLIANHEKHVGKHRMKTVNVENDPFNTQYLMKVNKDPTATIANYKQSRLYGKSN